MIKLAEKLCVGYGYAFPRDFLLTVSRAAEAFCSVCLDSFENRGSDRCPYCGQDPGMFDYGERIDRAASLENFDFWQFTFLLGVLRRYQKGIREGRDPKRHVHPFLEKSVMQHVTFRFAGEKKPAGDAIHVAGPSIDYPEEPIMCDICQKATMLYVKDAHGRRIDAYQLLINIPNMPDDGRLSVNLAYCRDCNQIKMFMPKAPKESMREYDTS